MREMNLMSANIPDQALTSLQGPAYALQQPSPKARELRIEGWMGGLIGGRVDGDRKCLSNSLNFKHVNKYVIRLTTNQC